MSEFYAKYTTTKTKDDKIQKQEKNTPGFFLY